MKNLYNTVKIVFFVLIVMQAHICTAQFELSKFHYRLNQKDLDEAEMKLLFIDSSNNGPTYYIDDNQFKHGIECLMSLNGNDISVDFWSLSFRNKPKKDGESDTLSYSTPLPAAPQNGGFIITDSRDILGKPTRTLKVPFFSWDDFIGIIPFKYRSPIKLSNGTKINSLVTTNGDLTFGYGRTYGKARISTRKIIQNSITIAPFLGGTTETLQNGDVKSNSQIITGNLTQVNPALMYGLQIIFSRNSVGLLIAVGYDMNFGSFSNDWVYQNKPWFGIGFTVNSGLFQ